MFDNTITKKKEKMFDNTINLLSMLKDNKETINNIYIEKFGIINDEEQIIVSTLNKKQESIIEELFNIWLNEK